MISTFGEILENQIISFFVLFLVGLLSSLLNINAGGGSTLTLPTLIFLGLDTATANGTNRLGILVQNTSAIYSYKKENYSDYKTSLKLSLVAIPGAIFGAFYAIEINDIIFKTILSVVLLLVIATLFIPRKKNQVYFTEKISIWVYISLFFAGFYGGVVQAGIGFLLMSILYNIQKMELVHVNMHKVFIVFVYTIPVIAIFIFSGKINWFLGLALASGTAIGAKIAVKLQVRKGEKIIKPVLVIVLFIMAAKLANLI